MRKIGWAASILITYTMFTCASGAEDSIDLNKYTCARFLADTADKTDGNKLVRSRTMISRAISHATAQKKAVPLADTEALRLVAASLGNACRKEPNTPIVIAIVHIVDEFNNARAQSKTAAKDSTSKNPMALYWNHNGSLVSLVLEGAKQKIYYQAPRIGLVDAGVKTGSLLFEGKRNGPTLVGTAYLFYRACKPQGYQVSGDTSEDRRQIILKGKAPLLDSNCNVTGSRDDVLIFTANQSAPSKPPTDTPVAGAPAANAAAATPSTASAATNSVVAGAVVPSAPPGTSRAPDIPVVEGGNAKSGDAGTPSNATSVAAAVAPSEAAKDKQVPINPGLESGTAPSGEPAKETQLVATSPNASSTADSPAAGSVAAPPSEPVKVNPPSTTPAAESAPPKSDVSNTGNIQAQQSSAAPQSEPPKDAQMAAIPGAVSGAAKTDDASKLKSSAAVGGAAKDLRATRKSEVPSADASKTGVLSENKTVPANATEKMMEIVLKNGRVLRIGRDIDPDALFRIISLLER